MNVYVLAGEQLLRILSLYIAGVCEIANAEGYLLMMLLLKAWF